jgi:hypothetical protein
MRALLLVAASLVVYCHYSLAQKRSGGALLPEETTEKVPEAGQLWDPDSETAGDAEEDTRAQPGLSPPTLSQPTLRPPRLSPPRPPSLPSPMSPRPGEASQDTQPAERKDNNKLAVIYYEYNYSTPTIHW